MRDHTGTTYRLRVPVAGGTVEAWSTVRLPFEPTGWLVAFRRDLADACRTLAAAPGQVMHATYTSTERGRVDVENVLTYNLGTGALRGAAVHGLLLERAFTATTDPDYLHHYRYQLAPAGQTWTGWRPGRPLGTVELVAPLAAFRNPKAGGWWLHARRGTLTAHEQRTTTPDAYLLQITVHPPAGWRGSLTGLLKPLADGLVSALHSHHGPTDTVVNRATTVDPRLTADEFAALLTEPRSAPLGAVRLVTAWGNTLQWLPSDDHIVGLDVRTTHDGTPGTVTAAATTALPLHA